METGKGTVNGDGGLCLYWLRILEIVRWVLILSAASVRKADAMGKCVRMATNIGRPETKSVKSTRTGHHSGSARRAGITASPSQGFWYNLAGSTVSFVYKVEHSGPLRSLLDMGPSRSSMSSTSTLFFA